MNIAVAVLIIAAIGVALFLRKKSSSESSAAPAPPSPRSGLSPDLEYGIILDSLLKLNILMRKDKEFPEEMTGEIETVIDDLMVITPSMMERYPGETLTYEIKKIGMTHLFKTVKEYLDLSPESRAAQLDIFKKTIESLKEVTRRSRDIVEKNETAEFKTMANFLAGKFS